METGKNKDFHGALRLELDVNDDRDMVTETRATPVLEGADRQLAHVDEPGGWQKDVIDMVGGARLFTVPPVDRRHRLLALRLASQCVVGTDKAQFFQGGDGIDMIDAPARPMPVNAIVEISCDDAWPLGEEAPILGERTSQRTELVLAGHAAAAVLRPHGQQIKLDGATDANWRKVAKPSVKGLGQAHPIAVEGEHGEPLVAVVAHPYRLGSDADRARPCLQSLRLGTFANDGNIGLQTEHRVELSMQGHAAIPSRKPHAANFQRETVAHHHRHDHAPPLLTASRQE